MVETHTRILGIAPYDGMRTAMEQAAQAYPNVELEVYTGDLEEGQAIVQRMAPNSYDCIISRGGTATLIRQVTDLPVVDIHISVYDVLRTMKLAENYTSLYAIVGFPSITEPAHTLCSLLNFDLDILTVRSAEEVRHTLERLKQGGYRMVVCDMVTHTIAREMGFDPKAVIPVSGQTYSRKVDAFVLNALAGIGQSCMKFATDLRLLANFKEMEEPFEKNQIGSSAMPYKRNPMRCERICALARYLMVDVLNPSFTTGTQWFERTLDDSANKRVAMAEGFLAADAILNIMLNVTDGIVVYPKVIRSRLMAELPFMASENIMMQAVEKGGNRQELHERLRQHAIAAGKQVKEEGLPNDMVDRIAADPAFGLTKEEIVAGLVPENFVGRAPQQVEEFIAHILKPIFDANPDAVEQHASLSV